MDVGYQTKYYQMQTVTNNYFDVIFYKEYNHDGAFPKMIRETFTIKRHEENVFFSVDAKEKCLLMGTSSLFTFFSCLILKCKGVNVTIAPLGQLHPFLDNDNPFEFGDEFSSKDWKLKTKNARRLDGKKSLKSTIRKIYRQVWKKVFVKLMFLICNHVLVVSKYEASIVKKNHKNSSVLRLDKWHYIPYQKEGLMINLDTSYINLIYWGRLDVYYKGLNTLMFAMSKLNNTRLYCSGGDYRGGKDKLLQMIDIYNLNNVFIIDEIVSYKCLQDFDYMVLPSRWEGYFRAPHDAKANNLKVIYRDATNYDFFKEKEDIEFSTDEELIEILLNNEKLRNEKN